jgi:hypothetical protein
LTPARKLPAKLPRIEHWRQTHRRLLSVTFRYQIVPCDELLEPEHRIMSDVAISE